jgi:hypothetical protein
MLKTIQIITWPMVSTSPKSHRNFAGMLEFPDDDMICPQIKRGHI